MPDIDTKLAQLETESLETHVAVAHERFKNLDQSIHRLEGLIEKIIIWASSTLFATMLLALLTSVFGGL